MHSFAVQPLSPFDMRVLAKSLVSLSKHGAFSNRLLLKATGLDLQRRFTMEASNRLKTAFAQGKQSMGMWQMIPGANVSRLLARSGVDWVMVDCEHGNIDGTSFILCHVCMRVADLFPSSRRRGHA
jgi:4-hydroxy-2-oxoheptanedioate aldolase